MTSAAAVQRDILVSLRALTTRVFKVPNTPKNFPRSMWNAWYKNCFPDPQTPHKHFHKTAHTQCAKPILLSHSPSHYTKQKEQHTLNFGLDNFM